MPTIANAKSNALVNTLADKLAGVEVETLRVTVAKLEAKKIQDTLGDRVAEMEVKG